MTRPDRATRGAWTRGVWLGGLLAFGMASCLWNSPFIETQSVPAEQPVATPPRGVPDPAGLAAPGGTALEANPRLEQSAAAAPVAPTGAASEATPPAVEAAPPVEAGTEPEPARSDPVGTGWRLPQAKVVPIHGLTLVFPESVPTHAGAVALVQLTVPVGSQVVSPGLAELGAAVTAELRLPRRPGGSLRGALAQLGASLDVLVGPGSTTFEIACPPSAWRPVLAVLAENLAQPIDPDVPGEAFDLVRTGLAQRIAVIANSDPLLAVVGRVCRASSLAPAELVSEVSQRTAAEVGVLQRTRYRAAGAMLALWLPGVPSASIGAATEASLSPWLDHNVAAPPESFVASPPLESGVFWAPRDGGVEVALVLPSLPLEQDLAAEMAVLYECLTHDGLGGRLGYAIEALVGRDVLFEQVTARDTDHVVLRARANGAVVLPLWEAISEVMNSFRLQPPNGEELREAAARARVRLLDRLAKPAEWSRMMSWLVYHRASPGALAAVLERLAAPDRLDIVRAVPTFVGATLSLAVVGGAPPAESVRRVQVLTDVAASAERTQRVLPAAERVAAETAARQFLEDAVSMAGGAAQLAAVTGYTEVARAETGIGPACSLDVSFAEPAKLREVRQILATKIETTIDNGAGVDRVGTEEVALSLDEVKSRVDGAARHPLTLLARCARGQVQFRQVALRLVDGREYAVLEEVSDLRDPMRVVIDTGSHLIRTIESRTWHPESGSTVLLEEFSDYRPVKGGFRVPFMRLRTADDPDAPVRVRTESFEVATRR